MAIATTPLNTPNKVNNFRPADDQWETVLLPFKASTAIAQGAAVWVEIVTNDVTGNLTLMGVQNAAGADFVGIMAEPITSSDADYATAGKLKAVKVPTSTKSTAFFTVGAGTFTAADVFRTARFHTDSLGLAVDTIGLWARIVKYISSTRGICEFSCPTTMTA